MLTETMQTLVSIWLPRATMYQFDIFSILLIAVRTPAPISPVQKKNIDLVRDVSVVDIPVGCAVEAERTSEYVF